MGAPGIAQHDNRHTWAHVSWHVLLVRRPQMDAACTVDAERGAGGPGARQPVHDTGPVHGSDPDALPPAYRSMWLYVAPTYSIRFCNRLHAVPAIEGRLSSTRRRPDPDRRRSGPTHVEGDVPCRGVSRKPALGLPSALPCLSPASCPATLRRSPATRGPPPPAPGRAERGRRARSNARWRGRGSRR